MQLTPCDVCQKDGIPINDSIKVDGKRYCLDCLNAHFPDQEQLKERVLEKDLDPTVCASCGADHGDTVLKKIAKYPLCEPCSQAINNRVFPPWVKLFMAAVALLVVFSFIWNWRFYEAFHNIEASNLAFGQANVSQAAALMQAASRQVPEVADIGHVAQYFNGISLLQQDKSAEALAEFNRCKDYLPPEVDMNRWIAEAEMGTGFDTKDYDLFLSAAQKLVAANDTVAMAWAAVASAYACVYADKGVDSVKTLALSALTRAKAIDSTSAEMKEYSMRIEHRIYTREIIKKEDFDKKYPNGWTKN